MHGWDKTTSGFGKWKAAIFELYFRFRFLPVCSSYRDVILHPPAKFLAVRRLAAELWRHIHFSRWRPWNRKSTFGFRFRNGSRLRRWIFICMSNFDEISQSTAKIKLLPVSENGRPPYWNCASGFDFNLFIVIGKSFCISMSNFVIIGLSAAKLWRHNNFSRWRS